MKTAYLSIGSNVGLREASVLRAVRLVDAIAGLSVVKLSSLYETEPFDCPPQPNFINAALEVKTLLIPGDLLNRLKAIEREMGRTGEQNQPREIDIDIISYDRITRRSRDLILPHPRYAERAFVLIPMQEIAPHFICPLKGRSLEKMIRMLPGLEGVRKISSRKIVF